MSRHIGRLTKMKTLNSMRTEKHRKTAYRMMQAKPSRQSKVHLFKWTPRTVKNTEASKSPTENMSPLLLRWMMEP